MSIYYQSHTRSKIIELGCMEAMLRCVKAIATFKDLRMVLNVKKCTL